jgi:hypothetical protein
MSASASPITELPTAAAVALMAFAGAALWLPVFGLADLGLGSINGLWYAAAYPLMMVAPFFLSRWHPRRPWLLAIAMVLASYVTALSVVPGTGNLLPFEVAIMAGLTLPIAFAAKSGAKYWTSSHDAKVGG